jgi:hypothetical protein
VTVDARKSYVQEATMKIFLLLAVSSISFLLMPIEASAHCAGKHTGDHPHCVSEPPPPPSGCTDTFPAFLYSAGTTRKSEPDLRLASSDACRTESVATEFGIANYHMTDIQADGSVSGVIVWVEDAPGENPLQSKIVKRTDFTVDGSGNLTVVPAVTILPLIGEEPVQGDLLHYDYIDIWGNSSHDLLYMAIVLQRQFNSGGNAGTGTREILIYNLNDLTGNLANPAGVHAIYSLADISIQDWNAWQPGGWQDAGDPSTLPDCNLVAHPQYVPTCYLGGEIRFNPSGTRLYHSNSLGRDLHNSEDESWASTLRIKTEDMAAGDPITEWNLAGPEMVWTFDFFTEGDKPYGATPRPDANRHVRPDPEIVEASAEFLNADLCVSEYLPYIGGNAEPQSDLWVGCKVNLIAAPRGGWIVWDTPDSYLFERLSQQGKPRQDIFRLHVTGASAGTEELLIENAAQPDTGM